ncbi:MAG: acyl-CoA dehydrogenase family protein [Leptospiraceae bacterium]|nr:acyl-CoA dehydrogenase family protein [Leptospiraceae bacterium]
MEMTKDFLENFSNDYNETEIFSQVYSFLIQDGFFQVLESKDCQAFHEKIYELVKYPHGLGVALSIIPIVNLAGTLLLVARENESSFASLLFEGVLKGEVIPAVGVSEKDWQGRLSKLQTRLQKEENGLIVNGSKSFVTNALAATHLIIIAKLEEKYQVIVLPKSEKGISINYFRLSFAQESTHASVELKNVKVLPEWILPIDYSNWGEKARLNEIFSLSYIVNSYLRKVTHSLVPIALEKEVWKNSFENQKKIFDFFQVLDMQKCMLDFISMKKGGENFLTYPIESKFPFGLPIIITHFIELWKDVFSNSELVELFPDLHLLFYYNLEHDFSFKKSVRSFYQNLFQISGEQFLIDV